MKKREFVDKFRAKRRRKFVERLTPMAGSHGLRFQRDETRMSKEREKYKRKQILKNGNAGAKSQVKPKGRL
jgi:hypothetical protein